MTPIGLGLIGVGRHGRRYAQHLKDGIPGLRLVAFARRDAVERERLAAELDVPGYPDGGALLEAPGIDAVAVVIPPVYHEAIVLAAAAAGKPVLLEKPAAVSLETGRRMLRAARAAGVPVLVAQTMRYNEVIDVVRREAEALGPLHAIRVGQRFEPSPTPWIADPEVARAGTLLHTGIHGTDLLRFLAGSEVEHVTCSTSVVGSGPFEDNFNLIATLDGGRLLGSVSGCRATAARSGAVEVAGREGMVVADHAHRWAWRIRGSRSEALEIPPPVSTLERVLRDFEATVRGTRPNPIPLEEGLASLAVVDAGYRAAASGRREPVAPV